MKQPLLSLSSRSGSPSALAWQKRLLTLLLLLTLPLATFAITSTITVSPTTAAPGTTVVYTLTLTNTSGTTRNDIPTTLTLSGGARPTAQAALSSTGATINNYNATSGVVTFTSSSVDLASGNGTTKVITLSVVLASPLAAGATLTGAAATTGGTNTNSTATVPAGRSNVVTISNVAPVADDDDGGPVGTNSATLVLDILANDTDVNGNATLNTSSITLGTATGTSSGTFAKGTGANAGKVVFTPGATAGTATITYTVNDAGGLSSNAATITVTVTGPPTANPGAASVSYKAASASISILGNDVAAGDGTGGNAINVGSVSLTQGGTSGTSNIAGSNGGRFSVNASGVVTFVPPASITGASITTSVSYTVSNSATPAQASAAATITVTVTNAAPAVIDGVNAALVNTAAATALLPSLRGNDPEGDLSYYTITGGLPTAAQGALSFNGTSITTVPSVNISAGQLNLLTFDPAPGYVGRVVLTFTTTDGSGVASAPTTYTIPVAAAGTISGIVYEDANYGGGLGRSQAASGSAGVNGATVELYNGSTLQGSTSTATIGGVPGSYLFSGLAAGSYSVRVVNGTVGSNRGGYVAGLLPVQTYVNSDGNRVGGEVPSAADAAAGTLTGAQSVQALALAASGAAGSDFGFSFDVVVNTNDAGQGSLRQFIGNAAALTNTGLNQRTFNHNGLDAGPNFPAGQETSIFMLADGTAKPGLRAGLANLLTNASGAAATTDSRALITLTTALTLPNSASAAGTALDGTTQSTLNNSNAVALGTGGTVGVTLLTLSKVNGLEVELAGASSLAELLQASADNFTLRGLALHGGNNMVLISGGTGILLEQNVFGINAFTVALPTPATNATAVYLTNPSGTVRNNIIAYAGNSGLSYSGIGAGYTITDNEFFQNGQRTAGGDNITIADQIAAGSVAGPVTITGNLIARSNSSGIQFDINKLSANTVQDNTISENGLGGTASRLEGSGIHYLSRNGSERGTNADLISRNVIINNQSSGIVINQGQRGVRFSQNSIYQNGNGTTGGQGLLSIDHTPPTYYVNSGDANGKARYGQGDGVSPNDGVVDVNQANGGMDYPIITSIAKVGTNQLRITGYIGNNPAGNATFANATVEVYSANNADNNQFGPTTTTSGDNVSHGEAQTYVTVLTADATGRFDVTTPVAATINNGDIITSTAFLAAYGTSEAGVNLTSTFTVLPVELTTFTATATGADAKLRWTTASEKNNDHFTVERSLDGTRFTAIGTAQGHGSSTQAHTYGFTDTNIGNKATGPVYYRLQQVDTDGTTSTSPVRVLRFATALRQAQLLLYPNPATEHATLDLTALDGTYQVTVVDMSGRTISSGTGAGGNKYPLDLQRLPQGTYVVLVRGAGGKFNQTLVKE